MLKYLNQKISLFKRKIKSEKKSYSFGGCDLLVDYIFKSKNKGFYLDVGCQHPISNNNTYLLYKKGWNGINIDLDKKNINLFNLERPKDINICACLSSKNDIKDLYFYHTGSPINSLEIKTTKNNNNYTIKKINTISLNSVLKNIKTSNIDYLNIDVEGHEMEVLKGFDINYYKPNVISIEFLDFKMNKMEFKNNNLESILNSDIYKYFTDNNYHFVNWIHADLIFVHKKFRD
tara:strand:- start:99 stop:797 length:699 start_codon:yes stop_codon:yes gene_type:complete